ncbi:hypothetical protein [Mesorhizobium sp.]|uniref:hypothetical protein n=1 Tax=Mesorhizobium sp. TaxID=1871066 RepID=UPI0025F9FFA7|nr:hypothetical protein [Mesorhizobium sp.]
MLGDLNVQRNGRRGRRPDGVDLFGVRNGDLNHQLRNVLLEIAELPQHLRNLR